MGIIEEVMAIVCCFDFPWPDGKLGKFVTGQNRSFYASRSLIDDNLRRRLLGIRFSE
jgi:hypothetical protein